MSQVYPKPNKTYSSNSQFKELFGLLSLSLLGGLLGSRLLGSGLLLALSSLGLLLGVLVSDSAGDDLVGQVGSVGPPDAHLGDGGLVDRLVVEGIHLSHGSGVSVLNALNCLKVNVNCISGILGVCKIPSVVVVVLTVEVYAYAAVTAVNKTELVSYANLRRGNNLKCGGSLGVSAGVAGGVDNCGAALSELVGAVVNCNNAGNGVIIFASSRVVRTASTSWRPLTFS